MTPQRALEWLLMAGMIIVVILLVYALSGCVIESESRGDTGNLHVKVDCKENAEVEVNFDLDQTQNKDSTKTDGIPVPVK